LGSCLNLHMEKILGLQPQQFASLGSQLEYWAKVKPGHPAFIYNKRVLSYQDFNKLANRYANFFNSQGFSRGDAVALIMKNKPEFLAIVAGLSKIGVITSLINYELREEVLAYGINISEARAVILDADTQHLYKTVQDRVRLKSPGLVFLDSALPTLIASCSDANPLIIPAINSEDILAYLFTSGSKGKRKAVPLVQKRWLMVGRQVCLNGYMDERTIQYMCLPLYLNGGFTFCFAGMIASGSTMVIKESFSAQHFLPDIREAGANYFTGVGEMFRYLLAGAEAADDPSNPLETAISNGIQSELIEPFRQRFGLKHMIEMYGTTENVGSFINHQEIPGMLGSLSLNGIRQGEVIHYDPQSLEPQRDEKGRAQKCQPGESGLLVCEINELNPFLGYVKDPLATAAQVLHDLFRENDAYINTGDIMHLHEGEHLSFVDRLGDSYRWKGKTVSADSVAEVIRKFYGGIEDVAVYGVRVPGFEGRCGMAAIRILDNLVLDWKALAAHINKRMPDHARPLFFRVCFGLEKRDLKKHRQQLQSEGYNPLLVDDELFYYDPKQQTYLPMNSDIYLSIIMQEMGID